MGLFKQMKDLKTTVAAAPGMIDQAQQLQANAAQFQAAQAQAVAAGQVPGVMGGVGGPVDAAMLEPIAGISLEEYARISKVIGTRQLDQSGIEGYVISQGHGTADWQAAYDGWNQRFKGNTALAVHFGNLYQQTVV